WLFGGHSPAIGLSPSAAVELLPLFPHVCPSALSPPVGKSWIDKRMPNYKIFLNNSFALDSTWIYPEESGLFHSHEKPHFLANQVTPSLSRPAPASRPLPTVVLAAQPIPGGCHNSLKLISSGPTITITAATAAAATAMVSVDAEELQGLSPSIMQPYHFLTLTPIRIPLRTAPFSVYKLFKLIPSKSVLIGPSLLLYLPPRVLRLTGNFYILSSCRAGIFFSCYLALDSSSSFPCPTFRAIAKSLKLKPGSDSRNSQEYM
ncbi:hypothetical protein STEG23_023741, partial [Scotinomys teguina]